MNGILKRCSCGSQPIFQFFNGFAVFSGSFLTITRYYMYAKQTG